MSKERKLWIVVGVPGIGKTTWINANFPNATRWPDINLSPLSEVAFVASSDDIIQYQADSEQTTYSAVFSWMVEHASTLFWHGIEVGCANGLDIIVDRTNLTVKSRRRFINIAKKHGYEIYAVVLQADLTDDSAQRTWEQRLDRPGKSIPSHVLKTMLSSFQFPTIDEGFTEITTHKMF